MTPAGGAVKGRRGREPKSKPLIFVIVIMIVNVVTVVLCIAIYSLLACEDDNFKIRAKTRRQRKY